MNKTKSTMQDHSEIQELADEMKHICPHCDSNWTELDQIIKQYWCNDCQRWDDVGDEDEQSREEIARNENAVIDRQERR